MTVIDRFLKLVSYPTTSDERSETCPSTPRQLALAEELVRQMQEMGIADAHVDADGYVYGTIPANCEKDIPVYGLIAHMDTAPDAPGENICARVTEAYDGGDVVLNEEKHIVLSPEEYPQLKNAVGKRLIVTDGTTLLGADDKAGVAEILSAAELLLTSDRPHGTVKLAFTPDEEIGRGADRFDVAGFGADYAYTVDGGAIGELEYENFNAASAKIIIRGKSIHPGSAKGQMVNAALVAMELHGLLPALETPYYTDGYEGFYHLTGMQGETEQAELQLYHPRPRPGKVRGPEGRHAEGLRRDRPPLRRRDRGTHAARQLLQHEREDRALHVPDRKRKTGHGAARHRAEGRPHPRRHGRRAALV